MKLLLDSCISPGAVTALREAGHDVVGVGDRDKDPGDEQILAESRALVTLDKDFGELVNRSSLSTERSSRPRPSSQPNRDESGFVEPTTRQ